MALVSLSVFVGVGSLVAWSAFRHPRVAPLGETDAYYTLASAAGVQAVIDRADWLPEDKPLLVSATPALRELPAYVEACADPTGQVVCVDPAPSTTQGEARNLGRIAREQGWRSATVISHRSHTTRARILVERCFEGEVRMSPRDAERGKRVWLRALAYESGATVKTLLTPGC
jgi:uncharacterized SAM-binding protein YcdF (DUF218 family)